MNFYRYFSSCVFQTLFGVDHYRLQEGWSVNARLYIAAFSHILETSIIFHRFRYNGTWCHTIAIYIPKPYFLFWPSYSWVPINWPGQITDPLGLWPQKYLATRQFNWPGGDFSKMIISNPAKYVTHFLFLNWVANPTKYLTIKSCILHDMYFNIAPLYDDQLRNVFKNI